uniref:hypothetical protein n=1 Tax=Campylobacter pinnipediorum TaxID=1965231 RepID=UPI00112FA1A5
MKISKIACATLFAVALTQGVFADEVDEYEYEDDIEMLEKVEDDYEYNYEILEKAKENYNNAIEILEKAKEYKPELDKLISEFETATKKEGFAEKLKSYKGDGPEADETIKGFLATTSEILEKYSTAIDVKGDNFKIKNLIGEDNTPIYIKPDGTKVEEEPNKGLYLEITPKKEASEATIKLIDRSDKKDEINLNKPTNNESEKYGKIFKDQTRIDEFVKLLDGLKIYVDNRLETRKNTLKEAEVAYGKELAYGFEVDSIDELAIVDKAFDNSYDVVKNATKNLAGEKGDGIKVSIGELSDNKSKNEVTIKTPEDAKKLKEALDLINKKDVTKEDIQKGSKQLVELGAKLANDKTIQKDATDKASTQQLFGLSAEITDTDQIITTNNEVDKFLKAVGLIETVEAGDLAIIKEIVLLDKQKELKDKFTEDKKKKLEEGISKNNKEKDKKITLNTDLKTFAKQKIALEDIKTALGSNNFDASKYDAAKATDEQKENKAAFDQAVKDAKAVGVVVDKKDLESANALKTKVDAASEAITNATSDVTEVLNKAEELIKAEELFQGAAELRTKAIIENPDNKLSSLAKVVANSVADIVLTNKAAEDYLADEKKYLVDFINANETSIQSATN